MKQENKIVEYNLTASEFSWEIKPGKNILAWGFNNQVPGPVLRAKKGDTLVVRVQNNLTESTMVHWHGLRLPATMDGTGEVHQPILPGESFEYRFTVPDAGTYWYHSHQNETVQMEKGMYGGIVIEDDNDPELALAIALSKSDTNVSSSSSSSAAAVDSTDSAADNNPKGLTGEALVKEQMRQKRLDALIKRGL